MNKQEKQYQISRNTRTHTALTNDWLKSKGLDERELVSDEPLLLQARKSAHAMLHEYAELVQYQKKEWLHDFHRRSKSIRLSERITSKEIHAVLNYAKAIKRQAFKLQRKQP